MNWIAPSGPIKKNSQLWKVKFLSQAESILYSVLSKKLESNSLHIATFVSPSITTLVNLLNSEFRTVNDWNEYDTKNECKELDMCIWENDNETRFEWTGFIITNGDLL